MEISNASKAIFAIKKKNEKAVKALREALKDEEAITIHLLPDIYPMGEERAVVTLLLSVRSMAVMSHMYLWMYRSAQALGK